MQWSRVGIAGFVAAAAIATGAGAAWGQPATTDDLAVRAAEAHAEHCAAVAGDNVASAAAGYQVVGALWGELDSALTEAPAPLPWLLYWRGLLAQCLGRPAEATADLEGFVAAEEFLGAVSQGQQSGIADMFRDARRRLRSLRREARGRARRPGSDRTAGPAPPRRSAARPDEPRTSVGASRPTSAEADGAAALPLDEATPADATPEGANDARGAGPAEATRAGAGDATPSEGRSLRADPPAGPDRAAPSPGGTGPRGALPRRLGAAEPARGERSACGRGGRGARARRWRSRGVWPREAGSR